MTNQYASAASTDGALKKSILRAEGFSCPSCVAKIEKQLATVEGVKDVKVSFATSKIEVQHDAAVAVDALVAQVAKAGFKSRPSAF